MSWTHPLPQRKVKISCLSAQGRARAIPTRRHATAPACSSRQPVFDFVERHASAEGRRSDIDQILLDNIARRVPLERGVVGPTGASSIVNPSVLGPPFALYGGVAGYRIIAAARTARAYLGLIREQVDELDAELRRLRKVAAESPAPATLASLNHRLEALAAFRQDVVRAGREQRFNQLVPGLVQMGASAGILTVGINSAPSLVHGSTLMGAAGTVALAAVAGGALCVFGGLSLARSGAETWRAWRRPARDPEAASTPMEKHFLKAYNDRLGVSRLFHSLNTLSWAGFVAGCGCMVGIAAGAALSHGAAIAAVIVTALGVVVWDSLWGERCAPRNALTPHIDRNQLGTLSARAEVWELLEAQRAAKKTLASALLATLPTSGRGLGKKERYQYIWRSMPLVGGEKRLASMASPEAAQSAVLSYMTQVMEMERRFFGTKVQRYKLAARQRRDEVQAIESQASSREHREALRAGTDHDDAITHELKKRLAAVKALHRELRAVHQSGKPCGSEDANRLMASFVVVSGMENDVFSGRDLEKEPESFSAVMRPKRWYARPRPAHIALNTRGIEGIESKGLSAGQGRRLLATLLSGQKLDYEMDSLFNMEALQKNLGG